MKNMYRTECIHSNKECVYTQSHTHSSFDCIHSVPYTFFIRPWIPLTPSVDKNCITARWACLEESMAWSLTVISLLFQSTTHCRYLVYTKFLLTSTAIYRRNRKVLLLVIMALQPQSHFHLGTPYIYHWERFRFIKNTVASFAFLLFLGVKDTIWITANLLPNTAVLISLPSESLKNDISC
jgi:hypothetical protein